MAKNQDKKKKCYCNRFNNVFKNIHIKKILKKKNEAPVSLNFDVTDRTQASKSKSACDMTSRVISSPQPSLFI